MVERRQARARVGVAPLSPGSLPPRWGEASAPPTTPHYTAANTPETSPRVQAMQISPDSDPGSRDSRDMTRDTCPATGAELLSDLHRRLMAHSVQGTLPRRPCHAPRHRKSRVSRHRLRDTRDNTVMTRDTRDYCMTLPAPDLLPSSAFNHPSRHTQYIVTREAGHESPSPTYSTSPPHTSLSHPSPPLPRPRSRQPLTSTMLGSPESSSSAGSALSHLTSAPGHQNSPASPELSSIPLRPQDVTQYQNIEAGIAYISASDLPASSSVANLSRFNVSPPSSAVLQPSRSVGRLSAKHRHKGKTVSWVADRRLHARHISDDRKVVKNQVQDWILQFYCTPGRPYSDTE